MVLSVHMGNFERVKKGKDRCNERVWAALNVQLPFSTRTLGNERLKSYAAIRAVFVSDRERVCLKLLMMMMGEKLSLMLGMLGALFMGVVSRSKCCRCCSKSEHVEFFSDWKLDDEMIKKKLGISRVSVFWLFFTLGFSHKILASEGLDIKMVYQLKY